uniref:Putative actin-like protein n=1 Tax=Trypanosoma congolense (strain IL3000) TaxID=1068625 RepID=G0UVJ7_TRYCI|nr:putative actin-like protein [Trypanosoma congolense IL3000]
MLSDMLVVRVFCFLGFVRYCVVGKFTCFASLNVLFLLLVFRMTGVSSVLFVDNGGYTLKALYFPDILRTDEKPPRVVVLPNCVGAASYVGRGIVGEQLSKLPHFHGFMVRRPVDRGFIVDAALQGYVWEYLLQHLAIADERQVELVITVPFAAPKQIGELLHYIVAQRFKFHAVTFVSSTFLSLVASASSDWLCCRCKGTGAAEGKRKRMHPDSKSVGDTGGLTGSGIVVDFGFSSTTVVPYINFLPVRDSIVRIDVGGKLLCNRLKELISFTQVNMAEDGWLVNHIMEQSCYAVLDPLTSLRVAKCGKRDRHQCGGVAEMRYYLPTLPPLMPLGCREGAIIQASGQRCCATGKAGAPARHFPSRGISHTRAPFSSGGCGHNQMGVVEAIVHGVSSRGSLQKVRALHQAMLHCVIAFGGVSNFANLRERLSADLQQHLPAEPSRGSASPEAGLAPLRDLVHRKDIKSVPMDDSSGGIGYTPRDNELQPLYGALALFTCPFREPQLRLLRDQCRVELHPTQTGKGVQCKTQASGGSKSLNAILLALQRLL